jgi:hypothetical protein
MKKPLKINRRIMKLPKSYHDLVSDYWVKHRRYHNYVLSYYETLNKLSDVYEKAASALLPSGKRHPHQYRLPKNADKEIFSKLNDSDAEKCRSFDALHTIICKTIGGTYGVGRLMVYDTALRIGAFLKCKPLFVYLHAGASEGAKALGFPSSLTKLSMHQLPTEFQKLQPSEVEDFLCIYKKQLKMKPYGEISKTRRNNEKYTSLYGSCLFNLSSYKLR